MRTHPRSVAAMVALALMASLLSVPLTVGPLAQPAAASEGFAGTSDDCEVDPAALSAEFAAFGGFPGAALGAFVGYLIDEIGWTWVDKAHKERDLNGTVEQLSHVTYTDLAITHDSHDVNFLVRPDLDKDGTQSDLLSDANVNDHITDDAYGDSFPLGLMEVEWETNNFPEWARPNIGDRVWMNGDWILDCGHEGSSTKHHFAEIHPPRAMATTRDQVRTMPGTGTTPVKVKSTDLYVHGLGGYVTTMLECGVTNIVLLDKVLPCDTRPGLTQSWTNPDGTAASGPSFDIKLDAPPTPNAVLATSVDLGPGNTLAPQPVLTPHLDTSSPTLHVDVPLAGTGASNGDVYARKINAGWIVPPNNLHRYNATLKNGVLHSDKDLDPGDCDCHMWMSVNRAETEWVNLAGFDRLTDSHPCSSFCFLDPCDSDFAGQFVDDKNTLDDWDDEEGCGDGSLNFAGPSYDFYLADSQDVAVQFAGYDSDCFDNWYGQPHSIEIQGIGVATCFITNLDDITQGESDPYPDNDNLRDTVAHFNASNVVGNHGIGNGNYTMNVNVIETPLNVEDKSDLALSKSCTPSAVKAATPFTCRIEVTNSGPGLPRAVQVTDTINTSIPASEYTIGTPTISFEGGASTPAAPCGVAANVITCNVGSVPIGGAKAVITYSVTSNEGGTISDTASVTTASTDTNAANNSASASVTVIPQANLKVTKTAAPSPVLAGGLLTYTVTATNAGPSSATNVSVSDTLPSVTLFKSATPSAGGTCSAPAVDSAGTVTCTWPGPTARDGVRSVQIVVEVPGPQTITNTASTASVTEDPDPSDNATSVPTQIICTIYGTAGNDKLNGTEGPDVICGLAGNDTISAGGGDDRVFGGPGNDNIRGDAGNDVLHGEEGDDNLQGRDGDDRLFGEGDNDKLLGGDGADFLNGGPGEDLCVDRPSSAPSAGSIQCEMGPPPP